MRMTESCLSAGLTRGRPGVVVHFKSPSLANEDPAAFDLV